MAEAPLRLNMTHINKAFGGVPVLRDVDMRVAPGEVVALLGSNGAGKSTLVKILSGVYSLDKGTIAVDEKPLRFAEAKDAIAAGIRMLPQEISIIPDMTVAENIALPKLPMAGIPKRVDYGEMRRRAKDLLRRLEFNDISPDVRVGSLSPARQRIVEVCRALQGGASILIMDEPTAALSSKEAETLFSIIRQLRSEKVSIIYISHYLSEVFAIADRIVVLRDGRNAGEYRPAATTPAEVLAAMLGQTMGNLFDPHTAALGQPFLSVEELTVANKLADVSFEVRAGEIVGAFGLVGSGLEHLGPALFCGRPSLASGRVALEGQPFQPVSPRHSVSRGIGFVAGERKRQGIVGQMSVRENLTLPFLPRYGSKGIVSRHRERNVADDWIRRLGIRTRGPEQTIGTLSGGNQQKVCIARWLTESIRLLILEEPTRGVDVGARRDIYRELRELSKAGYAILLISSDVDEVAGLSDRSFVLDKGRVAARFGAGASASEIMAAAGGTPILEELSNDQPKH